MDQQRAVARFHRRLVSIHPCPNGNGRHARATADHLSMALGLNRPTWGSGRAGNQIDVHALRSSYLVALHAVDLDPEHLEPLMAFTWSLK